MGFCYFLLVIFRVAPLLELLVYEKVKSFKESVRVSISFGG
jgi:hypothetical protein